MATINMYIGLNDKDTKQQEFTNFEAKTEISAILFKYFPDGFTLQECQGMYKHKDGTVVCENTIKVILLSCNTDVIFEVVHNLKNKLNQECIAVDIIQGATTFI